MIKMNETKIRFEKKVINFGSSKAITLSPDIMNFLGNPEEVYIMPDSSKHGKFLAIWSKIPPQKQGEQK